MNGFPAPQLVSVDCYPYIHIPTSKPPTQHMTILEAISDFSFCRSVIGPNKCSGVPGRIDMLESDTCFQESLTPAFSS